jgi:hypothetical protein
MIAMEPPCELSAREEYILRRCAGPLGPIPQSELDRIADEARGEQPFTYLSERTLELRLERERTGVWSVLSHEDVGDATQTRDQLRGEPAEATILRCAAWALKAAEYLEPVAGERYRVAAYDVAGTLMEYGIFIRIPNDRWEDDCWALSFNPIDK